MGVVFVKRWNHAGPPKLPVTAVKKSKANNRGTEIVVGISLTKKNVKTPTARKEHLLSRPKRKTNGFTGLLEFVRRITIAWGRFKPMVQSTGTLPIATTLPPTC
jgi:hypothetical protein